MRGLEWLDRDETQARVRSQSYLGGCFEPHCGLINPVKWADALRRLALDSGVQLYEATRVIERSEGGRPVSGQDGRRLGCCRSDRLCRERLHASSSWPAIEADACLCLHHRHDKLSDDQRAAIGWTGREGIEDGRNFMHFYRLTADGRLLVGGGPGVVPYAGNMDNDAYPKAWDHLVQFIGTTFPALRGIGVDYRWGGAFSVTSNSTPQVGTLDGGGAVYAIGCTGHGVAMTHMNGRIIRDLVLDRTTDLTDLWFVNRRSFPIPPEPLRSIAVKTVMTAMKLDDWWCDR